MIKLQVIGHLGKDAITNQVNGKSVINFNVAHTEKYKDSQGTVVENTTWVSCAYWTDKVAIAPYLKKGTQVYVEGNPSIRTWEKDGKSGAAQELRVSTIQLLGSAPQQQTPTQQPERRVDNVKQPAPADLVDDLPF